MLLDYEPQLVRLILRIYFNVVFIVLAVIGNQCVLYSTKLNILRKKSVNVTRMAGWLGSFEPFLTCLSMRRISWRLAWCTHDDISRAILYQRHRSQRSY